ncbi:hypothetical protein PAHAL_1G393300 [Panicum hallii]|uniref:RING-type domain-containing protein n=1 Tax=Panicum hallii TaxID=206008 RepID=A0A2S3GT30_9POAL|nr:E3 ubiquitin-protein ligase ATL23-like isoform X1 [Panicum hallii]PAN08173.1 hypothetical protein PAHAL_1G393300 [Panicum hallii]
MEDESVQLTWTRRSSELLRARPRRRAWWLCLASSFVAASMAGVTLSVLLLVAGVVAMLVLHILIVFWALRRGITLRAAASRQDEGRAEGLSAEDLDGLPCHDHEGKSGAGGECAVCLEAFRAGDRCRALPGCEHGFHAQCVDRWLSKSRVCPVCRAVVVVVDTSRGKAAGTVAGEAAASSEVVAERQGGRGSVARELGCEFAV